jgi:serine/threonine protein kinase
MRRCRPDSAERRLQTTSQQNGNPVAAASKLAQQRIGRFDLVRELGRGAQGTVVLARDSRLDRLVALKTLHGGVAQATERVRMLLDEARIVSRLQHPNIVTLFDAGEDGSAPYLVFEYVEGRPLNALIAAGNRPPVAQSVDIAIGVLRGMAFAHDKQVLHRDIKPANIMLTERGIPRIMDFGIASHGSGEKISDSALYGTPYYMAPEYVGTQTYLPASDQYSLGILLYELLTGAPPVTGANVYEVLHKIANARFAPPSSVNPEVDERLDAIVMKALARCPEDRYEGAEAMATALADFLAPAPSQGRKVSNGTLEFLLRRIRYKSDFPTLGNTIGAINKITASDREPTATLCDVILKDVALASKVLKVVNAATYGPFGGSISTISRAVAILGFDAVRNIATSLLLFEHLQNKGQAAALKEEIAATYFSAVLATELVSSLGIRCAEEAFICTMFHRLGRLLVTFYLHEDKQAIDGLAQSRGWDEERCAREVLGLGYDEIGMGVARQWNFPEEIVASMRPLGDVKVNKTVFESDRLRVVAEMATRLCDAVASDSESERETRIEVLMEQFGAATDMNRRKLGLAITTAVETFTREVPALGGGAHKLRMLERARGAGKAVLGGDNAAGAGKATQAGQVTQAGPTMRVLNGGAAGQLTQVNGFDPDSTQSMMAQTQLMDAPPGELFDSAGRPVDDNRQAVLAAGVQDITNTLVGEFALNDVLRIILETMFRGIGFQRMLLLIRDAQRNALMPRFGFGADVEDIIRSGFRIPLEISRDIFYAATGKGADICIEDIDAANVRDYVPGWYRDAIQARGMVLFPIRVNTTAIALIYGDAASVERLRFKPEELNLLKTLRNQAVLAVRQKS